MAEQGTQNEMISDADKKLDALCDMLKDACAKMDEGSKRMDARMDALEERADRMDADRRDSSKKDEDEEEKKDARKDGEEEEEKKDARKDGEMPEQFKKDRKDSRRKDEDEEEEGKPEPVVADKRKDSRRDAEEEEKKEERADAVADALSMTKAELVEVRAALASLQGRMPAILNDSDRERFASIQEQADGAFQAFGDHAPAPLDGETPTQYKRRLGSKLQMHSPKWKDVRLSAVSDDVILDTIMADVYADSLAAARKGVEVPKGKLRAVSTTSPAGHTIIEYEGESDAWTGQFSGRINRAGRHAA